MVETMSLAGGQKDYDFENGRYMTDTPCAGRKVIFLNDNGYDAERKEANSHFKENQVLTVKEIYVGRSSSEVEFEELPGARFNTVMFADLEELPEHQFTCELCGKQLLTKAERDLETEDIGDGWGWEVRHKKDFCISQEDMLKQIKQRMEDTTYGNWKLYETDQGPHIGTADDHAQLKGPAPVVSMSYYVEKPHHRIYMTPENAEFIAHSKQDMRWLITELEELRAKNQSER